MKKAFNIKSHRTYSENRKIVNYVPISQNGKWLYELFKTCSLECIGMKSKDIRPKVVRALEHVGLKDKLRSFPNELSGGEQQRVCIARAIVNEPKLLICDEPTGNLDPKTSKEIMQVLDDINKELGTTIVMATHDKEIVNRMKKRVIVLKEGRLINDYEKGTYADEDI